MIAPADTESLNISFYRLNERFDVIMVALFLLRDDNRLKSISPRSLSKEQYPNSSIITKLYFSNFVLYLFIWFNVITSFNSINRLDALTNSMFLFDKQDFIPSAIDNAVLPVLGLPIDMIFSLLII